MRPRKPLSSSKRFVCDPRHQKRIQVINNIDYECVGDLELAQFDQRRLVAILSLEKLFSRAFFESLNDFNRVVMPEPTVLRIWM